MTIYESLKNTFTQLAENRMSNYTYEDNNIVDHILQAVAKELEDFQKIPKAPEPKKVEIDWDRPVAAVRESKNEIFPVKWSYLENTPFYCISIFTWSKGGLTRSYGGNFDICGEPLRGKYEGNAQDFKIINLT